MTSPFRVHIWEYTMNQAQRGRCRALVLSCVVMVSGNVSLAFGQASDLKSSAVVGRIMTTALSRCYSMVNGVRRITFEPATNQEFAEVKALGQGAVAPLARYLDLQPKNGLTQLFAVKFLMAIGGPSTLGPLKRAFAQDQWEVTRAAALDGMFQVSRAEAKPYVEAALGDRSQLVRQSSRPVEFLSRADQMSERTHGPIKEDVKRKHLKNTCTLLRGGVFWRAARAE